MKQVHFHARNSCPFHRFFHRLFEIQPIETSWRERVMAKVNVAVSFFQGILALHSPFSEMQWPLSENSHCLPFHVEQIAVLSSSVRKAGAKPAVASNDSN